MDDTCTKLWQKLSLALKPQVSPDTFNRWFSAVRLVDANEDSLTFSVPNNIYQFWIESNHMSALQAAITSALGGPREVKFRPPSGITPDLSGTTTEVTELPPEPSRDAKAIGSALGLNPRNNFETFVVGPNNEIAHAASLAVAQSPARTYNPLFIYGGVGLGKTHLMQAIGQYVWAKKKSTKVMYLSSELFINEFIDAIQHNNLVKFRKRYRQAELLLIDDIQFLGPRPKSPTSSTGWFRASNGV
jgi:chromosomal replication initiator protein